MDKLENIFNNIDINNNQGNSNKYCDTEKSYEDKEWEQRLDHRERFATRTIELVNLYLIIVWVAVFINDSLSDAIKITLLWTTTATVIWLPLVIVRWLFKNENNNSSKRYKISIQNHKKKKSD